VLLFSKLLSQLLLPPGGLILLLLLGFLFCKRLFGRLLVVFSLMMFWALSTEVVRDILTRPLEFQYAPLAVQIEKPEATAIVLLGGGVYEKAPEYGAQDALQSYAMMRTIYAAKLAKQTGMAVYATGGRPLHTHQDAEGDVMRSWLIDFGVNEKHVFAEKFANNTWENARYIKSMLEKRGVKRIWLVTSAWHMPRAVRCFEMQGLTVIPAPTDYLTKQGTYDLRSYLPAGSAFHESVLALHEYLGFLFYAIRYGW